MRNTLKFVFCLGLHAALAATAYSAGEEPIQSDFLRIRFESSAVKVCEEDLTLIQSHNERQQLAKNSKEQRDLFDVFYDHLSEKGHWQGTLIDKLRELRGMEKDSPNYEVRLNEIRGFAKAQVNKIIPDGLEIREVFFDSLGNFSGVAISENALRSGKGIEFINKLKLSRLELTGLATDLAYLTRMPSLRGLAVVITADTKNIETLAKLSQLRELDLGGNTPIDGLVVDLTKLENLESVAIDFLSANLSGLKKIKTLHLGRTASVEASGIAKADLSRLEALSMTGARLESGVDFSKMPKLKNLSIHSFGPTSTSQFRNVKQLKNLEQLQLLNVSSAQDLLPEIVELKQLVKLRISESSLGRTFERPRFGGLIPGFAREPLRGINTLGELSNLQSLEIATSGEFEFSDTHFGFLEKLKNLRQVNVSVKLTKKFVGYLSALPKLQWVDFAWRRSKPNLSVLRELYALPNFEGFNERLTDNLVRFRDYAELYGVHPPQRLGFRTDLKGLELDSYYGKMIQAAAKYEQRRRERPEAFDVDTVLPGVEPGGYVLEYFRLSSGLYDVAPPPRGR